MEKPWASRSGGRGINREFLIISSQPNVYCTLFLCSPHFSLLMRATYQKKNSMKEESEGKTAVIVLQVTEYRKKFYITHQLNTFSALQCHYWNCELRFEAVLSLKHKETLCCFHSIFHLLCSSSSR